MLVVRTQPAKKRKESKALASRIKCTGFEMFLCSNCERGNKKCLVSDKENSSRCSECVLRGASCDVKGVLVGKWHTLEAEEARIKAEKETAFRLVCENMSCIERLERQQEFLKSKGKDMVCRGLKTLDELEEAKERERQMESKQTAQAAMLSSGPRPDALAPRAKSDPFASLEVPLLPPKVWAD
jgi:hypothetical protein